MTVANRLQALAKEYRKVGSHYRVTRIANRLTLNRRPRTTLAGAFVLLIGLIFAAGTHVIEAVAGNGGSSSPPSAQSKTNDASLSSQDAASANTSTTPDSSSSTDPADTSGQSTHDVNVATTTTTSTDSHGQPSTQVTVNGQPIDVPANGSTHQTKTSGNQQTNISVSQSTTGQSNTHTQVHISGHSTSDTEQEDSVSSH
jgi:hypothetical protein